MTLKSDAKFKEKFICGFKYGTRNLVDFFRWALFVQNMQGLSNKNTEELSFTTLNRDEKFE